MLCMCKKFVKVLFRFMKHIFTLPKICVDWNSSVI